jgi:tubulin--tyrosine ligase
MKAFYTAINKPLEDSLPETYIVSDISDPEYKKFKDKFNEFATPKDGVFTNNNVWIVKPGENTNRGVGIYVSRSLHEIHGYVPKKPSNKRTCIIQKYIEKPMLIKGRKFDIRMFVLLSCVGEYQKAYFYRDGYLRTSCREFSIWDMS